MSAPTTLPFLGLGDGEIRVAELLPGRWFDNLACNLRVVSLNDDPKPQYEALLYTWGDPNDTLPIIVNGTTFLATRNICFALRWLRSS